MNREVTENALKAAKHIVAYLEDKLESQLESEPAELRHGDYGYYADDLSWPILITTRPGDKDFLMLNHNTHTLNNVEARGYYYIIFGNIFDDLKAMAEDVESFEFDVHECHINKGEGWHGAVIHICGTNFTLEEAKEIHRKLGAMLATQQRKIKSNQ